VAHHLISRSLGGFLDLLVGFGKCDTEIGWELGNPTTLVEPVCLAGDRVLRPLSNDRRVRVLLRRGIYKSDGRKGTRHAHWAGDLGLIPALKIHSRLGGCMRAWRPLRSFLTPRPLLGARRLGYVQVQAPASGRALGSL
jgi:hypothetical protein